MQHGLSRCVHVYVKKTKKYIGACLGIGCLKRDCAEGLDGPLLCRYVLPRFVRSRMIRKISAATVSGRGEFDASFFEKEILYYICSEDAPMLKMENTADFNERCRRPTCMKVYNGE